jgi:hypothetical protein
MKYNTPLKTFISNMKKHRLEKQIIQKDLLRYQLTTTKVSNLELHNIGTVETFVSYLFFLIGSGVPIDALFINSNPKSKQNAFEYLNLVKNMKFFRERLGINTLVLATELQTKKRKIYDFEKDGSGTLELFYNYFVFLLNKGISPEELLFTKYENLENKFKKTKVIQKKLDELKGEIESVI